MPTKKHQHIYCPKCKKRPHFKLWGACKKCGPDEVCPNCKTCADCYRDKKKPRKRKSLLRWKTKASELEKRAIKNLRRRQARAKKKAGYALVKPRKRRKKR